MIYMRYPAWSYSDRVVRIGIFEIPVCTERAPRLGSYYISRRGEDEWRIAPVRHGYRIDRDHFIYLTGAPFVVNESMSELYNP